MRVAIITSGYFPVLDGVTITLHNRLKYLSSQGHELLVLAPDYRGMPAYPNWAEHTGDVLPHVRIVNLASKNFAGLDFERNFKRCALKAMDHALLEFKPDLIHVEEPERIFLTTLARVGIQAARKLNIPAVAQYHTNFLLYAEDYLIKLPGFLKPLCLFILKVILRIAYKGYFKILTPTQSAKIIAESYGLKNVVAGHFHEVDTTVFCPDKKQAGFWKKNQETHDFENRIKIIFVGRFTQDKGWRFLMRSLPELTKIMNPNNFAFILVGDGPLKEGLSKRFRSLNIRHFMPGRIKPDQVARYLANSDIYATCSENETLGLTLLEAQACGVSILAPDTPVMAEIINAGKTGLLYENQNVNDFICQVKKLAENQAERQKLSYNALQAVSRHLKTTGTENLILVWNHTLKEFPH